jgi:hypothetical protein
MATPAGVGTSYSALAFDGNTLYGLNLGTPPQLATIDLSGNVTTIGSTPLRIDGIAFRPTPVPAPLSIQSTANGVVISWPASAIGFRLQENTNLNTTNWVANTNSIAVTNGTDRVTVTPAVGTRFFRLINP